MTASFWRGKRVFLTGHTGFKGGWLALWLKDLGANLTGYALAPPTQPNLYETLGLASGMHSVFADIRDAERLIEEMAKATPDIVIHMAAQPLVRYSYVNPVETYATNVMGLVNLYEAVRKTSSVRATVNVTSDKCYDNREWVWGYRESDAMGGHDPYSSSKGCAELVTSAYRNSFFSRGASGRSMSLGSGRAGNVIGGGDWAQDRLVPDLLRAFDGGSPAKIRNPNAIRPWQHVLEPLRGYLSLAERLYVDGDEYAEGWNFGPSDADVRPVHWIADRMMEIWGTGATWELDAKPEFHEAQHLKLDCSKAAARLGWNPVWSLDQSLRKIVEWYKGFRQGDDMRALTLKQIRDYSRSTDKN